MVFRPSLVTIRSFADGSQGGGRPKIRGAACTPVEGDRPARTAFVQERESAGEQAREHVLGALKVLRHDLRGAHRVALADGGEQAAVLGVG